MGFKLPVLACCREIRKWAKMSSFGSSSGSLGGVRILRCTCLLAQRFGLFGRWGRRCRIFLAWVKFSDFNSKRSGFCDYFKSRVKPACSKWWSVVRACWMVCCCMMTKELQSTSDQGLSGRFWQSSQAAWSVGGSM
jgi:hypothetical protein